MKRKLAVFVLVLMVVLANNAFAAEWVHVGTNVDNTSVMYIDKESLEFNEKSNLALVWIKTDKSDGSIFMSHTAISLNRRIFCCKSITLYKREDASPITSTYRTDEMPCDNIIPESMMDGVRLFLIRYKSAL